MKDIKTYDQLMYFADSLIKQMDFIPENLILGIELEQRDFYNLMTGIPFEEYCRYIPENRTDSFTINYAMLKLKITIKQ